MNQPNFFILGAQKSGSTYLADVLAQHPEVFVARQEIHYFDKRHRLAKGLDWYLTHFAGAQYEKRIGEKTPDYLWANGEGTENHNPNVHLDLLRSFPDAKFVVVLRNPVDRALSALVHMIGSRRLPLTYPVDRFFDPEHAHQLRPWGILEKGLYARQLKAWFSIADRDQFLILCFEEDVKSAPREGLRKVCRHLGVDVSFQFSDLGESRNASPTTYRSLASALYRDRHWAIRAWWKFRFPGTGIALTPDVRHKLESFYRPENARLQQLLGRTMEAWESHEQLALPRPTPHI